MGTKKATASSLIEVTNQTRSTAVATNSMDILELLRKRGMDGDVDFLREALRVLAEGIIACPVPRHGGRRGVGADRRPAW